MQRFSQNMKRLAILAVLAVSAVHAQSIWVNDGGTLREITGIFINDAGTLRDIQEVWVNDAGTLRQVFSSVADFAPTVLGDSIGVQATDFVVGSLGDDEEAGNSSASADTDLWIVATGGNIHIKVSGTASGNSAADVDWFNPAHATQGAPDTNRVPGTTVFSLGEITGVTVNIFTIRANVPDGLTSVKIGTFTDDNKSTFFTPVADTDYGYAYNADADDPPSAGEVDAVTDYSVRQFTFRKAGFNDYTITMGTNVDAGALDSS